MTTRCKIYQKQEEIKKEELYINLIEELNKKDKELQHKNNIIQKLIANK
jgi:hypothetical protein